jgi:hypothetical protein
MDWLFGIFGVCSSRGAKPPPPAADVEKDSSAYKGPCAEDGDLPDDLMAPGRLYNLCKSKDAPPIDLVQQLLSDATKKSERISYKSPKDNECVYDDSAVPAAHATAASSRPLCTLPVATGTKPWSEFFWTPAPTSRRGTSERARCSCSAAPHNCVLQGEMHSVARCCRWWF